MRSGWGRDKLGSYWCQLGPKLGPHWKWILWHCDPLHLKQKRKSKISNFTDHFTLLTFIACCKRVCFEFWKWFVLKKRWRDLAARWRSALRNFTKPVGSRNLTIYVFKHNVLESSRQQQLCKSWKSWKSGIMHGTTFATIFRLIHLSLSCSNSATYDVCTYVV
jgi:hypothetical protein